MDFEGDKLFSDEFQTEFLKSLTITVTSTHLPVSVHSKRGMKEKDILEYFPVATTARKEELVDILSESSNRLLTQTVCVFEQS